MKNLTPEQQQQVKAEYARIKKTLKMRSKTELIDIIIHQGSLVELQNKKIEVYQKLLEEADSTIKSLQPEQPSQPEEEKKEQL